MKNLMKVIILKNLNIRFLCILMKSLQDNYFLILYLKEVLKTYYNSKVFGQPYTYTEETYNQFLLTTIKNVKQHAKGYIDHIEMHFEKLKQKVKTQGAKDKFDRNKKEYVREFSKHIRNLENILLFQIFVL